MMPVDFAERLLFSRYGGVGLGHLDEERDGDGGAKGRAATAAEAAAHEEVLLADAALHEAERAGRRQAAKEARAALAGHRMLERIARLEALSFKWATLVGGHGTFFGDQPLASEKYREHLEALGLIAPRRVWLLAVKEARQMAASKTKAAAAVNS